MTNTKILLTLLTLAMMTGAASAQQRTFYHSRGNVVGPQRRTAKARSRPRMRNERYWVLR